MLSQEEIVRVCALVVSTATGIDPLSRKERRGDHDLQYARAVWIHLIIVECGLDRGAAEYHCKRSLRAISYYLSEVEQWRTDTRFDACLERWGETVRFLTSMFAFDLNAVAPSRRERQITRAGLVQRAA